MIMFKAVELLVEHSYLLAVCHHASVTTIQLPHDLVDYELRVVEDVKQLDLELGGDAHVADEGHISCHIICHMEMWSKHEWS
jgi:hypothetical protein